MLGLPGADQRGVRPQRAGPLRRLDVGAAHRPDRPGPGPRGHPRPAARPARASSTDPTELAGREQTLYGAYLSAVAFASAGSGLHHKICHVLGGMFDLPHAETHAVVLPYVLALNAPAVPDLDAPDGRGVRTPTTALGRPAAVCATRSTRRARCATSAWPRTTYRRPSSRSSRRRRRATRAGHGRERSRRCCDARLGGEGAGDERRSPAEQQAREDGLVERVVASFAGTPDPRTRELVEALTRHLHAFLRETRLTEEEWKRAIDFLTAVGHITDDRRQEFILLSDVLGASMQTITINNEAYANATEATVFGPFFVEGSPDVGLGGDIAGGAPGEPCWVEGTVTDTDGAPGRRRAGSRCGRPTPTGCYDVQYDDDRVAGRGHLHTDDRGRLPLLGGDPHAVPDPRRRPRRRRCSAPPAAPRCAPPTCT